MINIPSQEAFPFSIAKYTPWSRSTLGTANFSPQWWLQFLNYVLSGKKQTILVTDSMKMFLFSDIRNTLCVTVPLTKQQLKNSSCTKSAG